MKNIVKLAMAVVVTATTASCSSNPKPAKADDTSTFTNNSRIITEASDTSKNADSTKADTSTAKP